MRFLVGAVLLALLALAIATVALGVIATLRMPRPDDGEPRRARAGEPRRARAGEPRRARAGEPR